MAPKREPRVGAYNPILSLRPPVCSASAHTGLLEGM